jgi:hypothetical protein
MHEYPQIVEMKGVIEKDISLWKWIKNIIILFLVIGAVGSIYRHNQRNIC